MLCPETVAHAQMDFNITFYVAGSKVTYTCDTLYELMGPPSITCLQDPKNGVFAWTPGPGCNKQAYAGTTTSTPQTAGPPVTTATQPTSASVTTSAGSTTGTSPTTGWSVTTATPPTTASVTQSAGTTTSTPQTAGPPVTTATQPTTASVTTSAGSTTGTSPTTGWSVTTATPPTTASVTPSAGTTNSTPQTAGPPVTTATQPTTASVTTSAGSTTGTTPTTGWSVTTATPPTTASVTKSAESTTGITQTTSPSVTTSTPLTTSSVTTSGTSGLQFLFGIPDIYFGPPGYIKMYIASKYVSTVNIAASGTANNLITFANTTTVVTIPRSILATSAGVSNKAVYVETDKPVSVYVVVRYPLTSDGFLLYPLSADANEFVVASYETIETYRSEFLITAFEDNTRIDVRLRTSAGYITIGGQRFTSGQNVLFEMDKMQTFLVQHYHDLTGTHITSSKPVSIVSGASCANVPHSIRSCDFLAEQLLPVHFWQHEYVCAKLKTRANNRLRVLSSTDSNAVNIGGTQVSLNDGDFYEYVSSKDAASAVISTHPVLVIQYAEGYEADNETGDPSMITVPSTNIQESEYYYETPTPVVNHYVSISVHTDHANGLRIDGATIDRSDELKATINTIEFSIIRVSFTAGQHHLYHVDPSVGFGVIVYGFDKDESYGFPLGLGSNGPTSVKRNKRSMNSTSTFAVETQFYIDPYFQQEISGNQLDVRTVVSVFVKAFVKNVDWTMKMRLLSCYAEPTLGGHATRHYLIDNGCAIDASTHFLSQTDHETRFVFQATQITGPDHRLHIKCDATLCDTSDVTSSHRCGQRTNCLKL